MNKPIFKQFDIKNQTIFVKIAVSISVVVCFAAFFILYPMQSLSQPNDFDGAFLLSFCIVILSITALFFMFRANLCLDITFAALLVISAAALALRLFLFDNTSRDYNVFLSQWLSQMRLLDGVEAIKTPIGDYNMPYLYFLFVISKLKLYDLYLIKALSVLFDFILAFGIVKLARLFTKSDAAIIAVFTAALFAPTLFLNSAYWGQCDGVYSALCVWALYFALRGKGANSVIFFALAFSFKMQTIFILPLIIFLVLKHKISLKHLIFFPATFVATLVPALLCGRSFYDTFSIYISQTESYPQLSLNCHSLWAIFTNANFGFFGTAALFLAGGVCFSFIAYIYTKKDALTDKLLFDLAFIFTLLVPFLLPRMHERYFYLAEVLCIVYVLLNRERIFVAPAVLLLGFCVYSNYLFGTQILKLDLLGIINAFVIVYVIKKFADDLSAQFPKKPQHNNDKKECV